MTLSLDTEQRRQLGALLAYCREMGGPDFYRPAGETAIAEALPVPEPPGQIAEAARATAPAPSDISPDMPIRSRVLAPPPIIDFDSPGIPPEKRAEALAAIAAEIGDCQRCPLASAGRHRIVFGNGDPNAELFFVGEGPGADEDIQGLPFVGRGGQLLNNMIAAMGLKREQVYVANIVKCRPPKNRVPEPIEALTCVPFLFRQIDVVRPKLLVALGSTAATYLTGTKASLSVLRGRVHDCMGTKLVVTYHPAYLLRDPRQKAEAWKDLQLAMKFLKLPVPKKANS